MVEQKVLNDLFAAFPDSILKRSIEFVSYPHRMVNSFFRLDNCETREDVVAKLLEWLSRDAFKSMHFSAQWRNAQVHKYHLDGINQFCGTSFTPEDMELIYTKLGYCIRHQKTLEFIRSGYDMDVLRNNEEAKC